MIAPLKDGLFEVSRFGLEISDGTNECMVYTFVITDSSGHLSVTGLLSVRICVISHGAS